MLGIPKNEVTTHHKKRRCDHVRYENYQEIDDPYDRAKIDIHWER